MLRLVTNNAPTIAKRSRPSLVAKSMMPGDLRERINRIAGGMETPMTNMILSAFAKTAGDVVLKRVEEALAIGDIAAAEAAIPWDTMNINMAVLEDIIREGVEKAGSASAQALAETLDINFRFDLLNPRSVGWIKGNTARLVREVGVETRDAIKEVIDRAFTEGMHPYTSARHIRDLVGLTRRQALAVDNLRRRLIAEGVAAAKIDKQIASYAEKLLKQRAENIARTETIRASNMGQQELWRQAAEQGLIDARTVRRIWIAADDERTCPYCGYLDGKDVGLEEHFAATVETKTLESLTPPIHPQCRCSIGLVNQ